MYINQFKRYTNKKIAESINLELIEDKELLQVLLTATSEPQSLHSISQS